MAVHASLPPPALRDKARAKRELLSTPQAAAYLCLSKITLERWRWKRTGPPFCKLGFLIRYDRADLDAFVERSLIEPSVSNH